MSREPCEEWHLLIQADVDGELEPAQSARVANHLSHCPDCARLQDRLLGLSARITSNIAPHRAPPTMRSAIEANVRSAGRPGRAKARGRTYWLAGGGVAAASLAACLAVLAILPLRDATPDWIVAAHIRALQPDHLVDVRSGEQHTVKPWFAGRVPFAPPVKDLSADGFPLVGGRLDYLPGTVAATIVYKRREHVINLFIWPDGKDAAAVGSGIREGYNYVSWRAGGMSFWSVSDLNGRELSEFASLWQRDAR